MNMQLNQSIQKEIEMRCRLSELEFKEEIKEYQTPDQIELMLLREMSELKELNFELELETRENTEYDLRQDLIASSQREQRIR
jgi:hypothetical protein